MSKKKIVGTAKPSTPKPVARREDTAYLVREDLEDQLEGPARASPFKTATPATAAEQSPTAAASPAKPLAPLAALWPNSAAPLTDPPATAMAPKASSTAATPSPNPPAQPAPPTSPETSASTAQTHAPTPTKTVTVTFVLLDLGATEVSLSGEFNGWSPNATPMRRDSSGHWEATVALAPGRYEYKFIVEGEWIPDPLARENVWNDHGTLNSVIEVRV